MKLFTKNGLRIGLFTLFGLTIAQNQTSVEPPAIPSNNTSPRPPPSKSFPLSLGRINE